MRFQDVKRWVSPFSQDSEMQTEYMDRPTWPVGGLLECGIERRIANQLICSHESHCLIDQNTASLSFFNGTLSGSRMACSFLSRS